MVQPVRLDEEEGDVAFYTAGNPIAMQGAERLEGL
jgi:hypothetical protein